MKHRECPFLSRRLPLLFLLLAFVWTTGYAQQSGSQTPPAVREAGYALQKQKRVSSPFAAMDWQFVGPRNVSGRMTDVAVKTPKGSSYEIFVAGATGGVWHTNNEGVSWEPVFEQDASTSIGDVTLAPSNQDIVWVGTGEANIFRSSTAGSGVYKSTDGGKTWTHKGLTGTHTIPRIVIHPRNPDIVYVASSGHEWTNNPERGVYKTTNGGNTWEKVLYVNESTGVIDLVMDPSNPNTLYAATWQRIRKKWNDPRIDPGFDGSGIYKSTDAGKTWNPMNTGLPEAALRGRIGLDISQSNTKTLYAFIDNYSIVRMPGPDELDSYGRPRAPVIKGATVYRTDNGAASWHQVSANDSYMERLSSTYGWVFGQIRVDPQIPDRIYVMGLGLHVSDDGGASFRSLPGMHGDHHGLWIDPTNSDYLVNVNDGGVAISYDAGKNWRTFYDDLPLVQFFNVNVDMSTPFRVYGSIQDHGSRRGVVDLSRGRSNIPAVNFENAPGGEGSNHAIDPRDPDVIYSAGFYGSLSKTQYDTGISRSIVPEPPDGELAYRGQWLAPFILSPHNPDVVYHGMNYLFRSTNGGNSWERISDDLTDNNPDRLGDISFQTIFSISESPLRFGLIYAGTDDGRVHVTRDGGVSWTDLSDKFPDDRFVAEIVASAFHEGHVYLAMNGKRDDDFSVYLWKSEDYGESWTAIDSGIPIGPVNVIKEDPKLAGVLYVGTDVGVYISLDDGQSWEVLGGEFPSTFVHDLVIHPRDEILVAATHGRGIWAMDIRPVHQFVTSQHTSGILLFAPEPASTGGRFRAASCPLSFYSFGAQSYALEISDSEGSVRATLEGQSVNGVNQLEWDMQNEGRTVEPGVYTLLLSAGGSKSSQLLIVN